MISYKEALNETRTEKVRQMLVDLPSACADFINSITMTSSPLTRLAYTIDLQTFCEFATRELSYFADKKPMYWTDEDFASLTAKDLYQYSDYLTLYFKNEDDDDQKILRNHEYGVMRKLSSLRSFFGFMFKNERLPGNIATLVDLPKLHEKPILHLIGPEIEKLLEAAHEGTGLSSQHHQAYQKNTRTRDYAMLMLFLGTGMRVSECVGINLDDLDLNNNAVLVTRKGGNQVILYYPDEVKNALVNYMQERKKIQTANDDKKAFFLSLQKKRITQRAVQLMVKKYSAIAAPLKKRMSPHKLRSTYATNLYHETQDIYLVADALGHSDVNTTRRHYASMSEERRKQAAKNVHLPSSQSDDE